jgi:hypothetical protein
MLRSNPTTSMQKTYDECFLDCSTAVYFEREASVARVYVFTLRFILTLLYRIEQREGGTQVMEARARSDLPPQRIPHACQLQTQVGNRKGVV